MLATAHPAHLAPCGSLLSEDLRCHCLTDPSTARRGPLPTCLALWVESGGRVWGKTENGKLTGEGVKGWVAHRPLPHLPWDTKAAAAELRCEAGEIWDPSAGHQVPEPLCVGGRAWVPMGAPHYKVPHHALRPGGPSEPEGLL